MRQDQWSNTVTINGRPLGIWATLSGGDVEADNAKYRPGGMQPQIDLGGPTSTSDVTLARLLTREDWLIVRLLMQFGVGRARVVVSRQPLDADGNPFGKPIVYRGTLTHVEPGDTDADSGDAQTWQITVSVGGGVG